MTIDAARFGLYGGRYVPETLMPALVELEAAYAAARGDAAFQRELDSLLRDYSGRPTPLYRARRLSAHYCGGVGGMDGAGGDRDAGGTGGALSAGGTGRALSAGESNAGSVDAGVSGGASGVRIYLKREDLNHTGAHKINNCLGQALLARRMGKRRIVAETGAGQHGVATATVAALFGMECTVYMGEVDMARQRPNVLRMRLLGAEIAPVHSGTRTLKDATNETIRDWVTNVRTTHYIIGSTVGPHPYPTIVRDLQSVIGRETREQILAAEGRLPDDVVACVGGGSNALGIFTAFAGDKDVRLHGVEAGGSPDGHAAALLEGRPGVLHGAYSYLMQDDDGQVLPAHSIAPGLDYPGVGPEHAALKDSGRVVYGKVSDDEALSAFQDLSRLEGILPALESSHAVAYIRPLLSQSLGGNPRHGGSPRRSDNPQRSDNSRPGNDPSRNESSSPDRIIVVNLSGRGDKDIEAVEERLQS